MSLTITRRDTYTGVRRLVITVTDEDGAAVDLTGTELRFMVKRWKRDADAAALISKSTSSGIAIASPQSGDTKGVAYIALTGDEDGDTDVSAGAWYYELEATDSIGIITLAAGRLTVIADLIEGD